jgi:glycosyltransferase involved in cell wall biosynthesis
MRIAVDCSALHGPVDGIGRYLRSVLSRCLRSGPASHQWLLLGRSRAGLARALGLHEDLAGTDGRDLGHIRFLADHLPVDAGRVASLASSQPLWARRFCPEVYWGPAHRLPLWLPDTTARVVTVHDMCWRMYPDTMRASTRWLDSVLMPRALRAADRVIAVSRSTASDIATAFPDVEDSIVVIHEAAEALPAAEDRDTLRAAGITRPYVLYVGTREPRKNLQRLIDAFRRLPNGLADKTDLVIAGGRGWGQAADVSAAGIRTLGRVDDRMLSTLYRHAACLAFPSLYEGFGLPLVEAMSFGTPVVASSTSSIPELVGDAGLLVDPLDVDAISRALSAVLTDHQLRARLGSRAIKQAARFSWDLAASETLSTFASAIDVRRARLRRATG